LAGLSYADGNIIVGNGTTWVVESGSTARTTLGLGTSDSPNFAGLSLSGTAITSNASELNLLDGVNLTLSASEFNLLDGRSGTLVDSNNIGTYALTPINSSSYVVTSITAGTGISLSGTGPGNVSVSLANSGVVSGTYGSSTLIPIIQVDSTGRIIVAGSIAGGFLTSYTESDPIWSSSAASYFNLSDNEVVTGRPAFNGGTTGSNPPFTVDSQYLVTNLNADLLDGYSYDNLPYIPTNTYLSAIGALTPSAGNMIIGNGSTWVAQSGQTLLNTIGAQSQLNGTGFVKVSGTAVTYDNSGGGTTGDLTLNIGSGNGISVLDDSISLNIVTSGSSSSRSSVSGLELSSRGLSLIQGCTNDEVISWDSTNGWWECSSKLGGGAVAVDGSPLDNQLAVWSGGGTSIKDSNLWFVSGKLGVGTSAPSYDLEVSGSIMAQDFFAYDGTAGMSTTISVLTFKNGLYTSGTITGFLTAESYLGTVTQQILYRVQHILMR